MLQDKDAKKSERVMNAMLRMKKINIKGLKQAYRAVRFRTALKTVNRRHAKTLKTLAR